MKLHARMTGLIALLAASLCAAETATEYPSKPLAIIVAFTPGSGSDTQARLYGDLLSKELGQVVIIENKPGANGVIGLQAVKRAPADGYTLGMGGAFLVVNPVVMKQADYDPQEFRPIAVISSGPMGLLVGPDSRFRSLADLLAGATGDKVNIGTYTATYRLGAEWLAQSTGASFQNVTYKGAAQIVSDLTGGHLDAALVDFTSMKPLIKEGKLRALAITAEERVSDFPDVPTVRESVPGYALAVWTALVVRADTPPDIVTKLSTAMRKVLALPASQEYLQKAGFTQNRLTPDQLPVYQAEEYERYRRIAKAANLAAE